MHLGVTALRARDEFEVVELLATQRTRRRQLVDGKGRDTIDVKHVALRAQPLDRHARPVAQHFFRGRIGQHDGSPGVDDKHRFRHAVEHALHDRRRAAQFLMGCDQVLRAVGDRRLERQVGGAGGAERILQFAPRAAEFER